jgi:hypothetical protein
MGNPDEIFNKREVGRGMKTGVLHEGGSQAAYTGACPRPREPLLYLAFKRRIDRGVDFRTLTVGAFPLADMSASGKAGTCPCPLPTNFVVFEYLERLGNIL